MDAFTQALNKMLTTTYRSICKVEELMLRRLSNNTLSISEMHMLERIGKHGREGTMMTEIAQDLDITPPSATAMIKRLENKGYVSRIRSSEDARRVRVRLTQDGFQAEATHRYFHRKMVRAMTEGLTIEERGAMYSGLEKLNAFLRQQLDDHVAGKGVK